MTDAPQVTGSANTAPIEVQPETVIEQGQYWSVIVNRNQNLLGKVMLLASRPVERVTELTPDEWTDLHRQIRRVTQALEHAFRPDHFNYAFLQNQDRQVHLHIIPRYAAGRAFAGLAFDDPDYPAHYSVPAPARYLAPAQLSVIADTLRSLLVDAQPS